METWAEAGDSGTGMGWQGPGRWQWWGPGAMRGQKGRTEAAEDGDGAETMARGERGGHWRRGSHAPWWLQRLSRLVWCTPLADDVDCVHAHRRRNFNYGLEAADEKGP